MFQSSFAALGSSFIIAVERCNFPQTRADRIFAGRSAGAGWPFRVHFITELYLYTLGKFMLSSPLRTFGQAFGFNQMLLLFLARSSRRATLASGSSWRLPFQNPSRLKTYDLVPSYLIFNEAICFALSVKLPKLEIVMLVLLPRLV
jgi:hypothetical protein